MRAIDIGKPNQGSMAVLAQVHSRLLTANGTTIQSIVSVRVATPGVQFALPALPALSTAKHPKLDESRDDTS